MTAHDATLQRPSAPATAKLLRPLLLLTLLSVIVAAALFTLQRPFAASRFPAVALPRLALPGLGLVGASLLVTSLGLSSCLLLTLGRCRGRAGRMARWPQTVLTLVFAGAAPAEALTDWLPRDAGPGAISGFTAAAAMLLLAAPWLLADRYFATVRTEQLPERDDLRNLLFLPVFFLSVNALLQIAASLGFSSLAWIRTGLAAVLLLICLELTLRVLARWFLPPPDNAGARATIVSLGAELLHGRILSPAAVAGTVRTQFGMDFSRSWALHFIRGSAAPVALLMLVFCWFLTGVTRIDMNQRGAYERFGTVATILKPGLHLVLPWPFGAVRHLEFGVIHSTLISYGAEGAAPPVVDHSTAEGDAPATAARLWDSVQPTDVSYIIASSEQGRQSFQTVSASVRVLYRIGLSDAAAQAELYRVADPDVLVRSLTGQVLAQFFAGQTLPGVLGENQGVIAAEMRDHLRRALDRLGSGIDVVAVTVEAIHPPAGAATAYRNVQAAEIQATTDIATERGRAQTTQSVAEQNAHTATDDATASAAETVSSAQVDLTDIKADDVPYRADPRPFLLERYFADIQAALVNVPLEIVDHRLTGASAPTIDLRPPGASLDGTRMNQTENTR